MTHTIINDPEKRRHGKVDESHQVRRARLQSFLLRVLRGFQDNREDVNIREDDEETREDDDARGAAQTVHADHSRLFTRKV